MLPSPDICEYPYILACLNWLTLHHTACTQHQAAPTSGGGAGGGRVLSLLARLRAAAPSRFG